MYVREAELFEIEQFICIKMDLALNNLQRLVCHKIQPTNQLEMNNRWNVNFLRNSFLDIRYRYSSKVFIGRKASESIFI